MENKRIVHLYEFALSQSDLEKLSDDEVAFLATLGFAIDEISIFQKLVVQAFSKKPKDTVLLNLNGIQVNTVTRSLCAKLFEALRIFENYRKMVDRSGDTKTKEKLDEYERELTEFKRDPNYDLAKTIRDHSTNHYLPSETKKNIKHVPARARFVAYLHENQGNSFYPFGEEYVFFGRIGRYFSDEKKSGFAIDDIQNWIAWSLQISRWLNRMLSGYILWIHKERFPDLALKKKTPYLEMDFFAELGEKPLPLIYSVKSHLAEKQKK